MAPRTPTPRRSPTARRRSRPVPPSTDLVPRLTSTADGAATEPPPKRRRYIPGGAGGGGRFVEVDDIDTPLPKRSPSAPKRKSSGSRAAQTPLPKRERSTRVRRASLAADAEDMRYSSAAAVAAAVVQNEGYKPREERGWEEFHPNLDIDANFMVFTAPQVDGTVAMSAPSAPTNPATPTQAASPMTMNGVDLSVNPQLAADLGLISGTPPKRRVGRPPRDPLQYFIQRVGEGLGGTPKTPAVLPIYNQTPKERLDLKRPQYRKTDRILLFESKKFGQARYVDKSMMNIGYQESDIFIRSDNRLVKANDSIVDDDVDNASAKTSRGVDVPISMGGVLGRVEYDMDEQDDMWLETYNAERKKNDLEPITKEVFEITITKIEKEWHALEKRIPKPNPKPPQTHRPRSSSAAAVNGEPSGGEEQDSRCAICDDGDCENTNAIVFCDGCDLAVHQECYGVPFIPEGQWLCRKCQLIGRGVPTCIFCPNTDGAFKQTNSSKWSHLLCAMWIPEVNLGNHTFMEPVMDVEKVPRTRWKLTCYICNQKMGACIQCGNKSCYQAFHVTCARRAKLFLKMKNSHGALAVLDGSMVLKAFCDRHCPPDYAAEHAVGQATRQARKFYRRTMKELVWADNQNAANVLAATHRNALAEHPPDESEATGAALAAGGEKKKGAPAKPVWKLPSGAPIIPQAVFDIVENSLQRFAFRKRKEFVAEACKFWTLKRESRRGAALLKRLQLQMETFSSVELTRRNFAAMGSAGKARLTRRIRFAENLLKDLEQLKSLSEDVSQREAEKLEAAELEQEFVDACYFPVATLLPPIVEKALALDKDVFKDGLVKLRGKVDARFYATTLDFARDLCALIRAGVNTAPKLAARVARSDPQADPNSSPAKNTFGDKRERRRLGKRILKAIQPQLEGALQTETVITSKSLEELVKELDGMLEGCVEVLQPSITVSQEDEGEDTVMADAPSLQITVAGQEGQAPGGDAMDTSEDTGTQVAEGKGNIKLEDGVAVSVPTPESQRNNEKPHDTVPSIENTPPATNGYATPKPAHPTPPTPPQSTDSSSNPADPLTEGGLPWYLKGFEVVGTTVGDAERERSPSEELTDLDEVEMRELVDDVEKEKGQKAGRATRSSARRR